MKARKSTPRKKSSQRPMHKARTARPPAVPDARPTIHTGFTIEEVDALDATRQRIGALAEVARAAVVAHDESDDFSDEQLRDGVTALMLEIRADVEYIERVFHAARVRKIDAALNGGAR